MESIQKTTIIYVLSAYKIRSVVKNKTIVKKNPKDAFYKEDELPDIDFYSPDPLRDVVDLSNKLHAVFPSFFRNPLPMDCRFRILDLEGDAKITFSIDGILIPVENVP